MSRTLFDTSIISNATSPAPSPSLLAWMADRGDALATAAWPVQPGHPPQGRSPLNIVVVPAKAGTHLAAARAIRMNHPACHRRA